MGAVWRVGEGRPVHTCEHTVAVAQATAQQGLDVRLGGGTIRVVVRRWGAAGAAPAAPAAHQRPVADETGLPGQRVAAVAVARGVEAAQPDVDREVRGGGGQRQAFEAFHRRALPAGLIEVEHHDIRRLGPDSSLLLARRDFLA